MILKLIEIQLKSTLNDLNCGLIIRQMICRVKSEEKWKQFKEKSIISKNKNKAFISKFKLQSHTDLQKDKVNHYKSTLMLVNELYRWTLICNSLSLSLSLCSALLSLLSLWKGLRGELFETKRNQNNDWTLF